MKITTKYEEILERLNALFPVDQVKSFPMSVTKDKLKGMAAFYIDARAVQRRLDETCIWKNEFKEGPQGGVLGGISVLIETGEGCREWVTRWDAADNSDIEATKGGISGAMRRAAVNWGVGRYLYNVPGQWLEMQEGGKRFKVAPRIPNEFIPGAPATGRAKKVQPAQPPSEPPTVSTEAAPPVVQIVLTPEQVSAFAAASEGKDRKAIRPIYNLILKGELSFEDALGQVGAL